LPEITTQLVGAALRDVLGDYPSGDLSGVCCMADGGDYLFADAILNRGGVLDIVVPCTGYREALPEGYWSDYDRMMAMARSATRLPYPASTPEAHMAASRYVVNNSDVLIAIWDGKPARAFGGTADVVAYAKEQGKPVVVVWPAGAERD
jgi:hypothetical protein